MKFLKEYSKFYLKLILLYIKYNVNSISKKEANFQKIDFINNFYKRKKYVENLINKYPKDPFLQLKMYEISLYGSEKNFVNHLNLYQKKNEEWLKESKLSELNLEFIPPAIIIGALGLVEHLEVLILANKYNLRSKKKLCLLLDEKLKPRNTALFEYFKDYFTIIKKSSDIRSILKLSEKLEIPLGSTLNFYDRSLTIWQSSNYIEMHKPKNNANKPLFSIKKDHKEFGLKQLEKVKVPKDAWFVTVHIREPEPGYRGETSKNTTEKFRNANSMNYLLAIKSVISAGGYVFRMGYPGITKMPKIDGLIDYANSEIKSEVMDLFLGATCKFCIGTSSGYYAIPKIFSVPILLVDSPVHETYFSLKEQDIYLPRLFMSIKENKILKFSDMFSYPLNFLSSDKEYKKFNIKVIENSPDEINNATKEMIQRIVFKKEKSSNNEDQKKLKNIIETIIFQQTNSKIKAFADISPSFLKKNINLL